MTERPMIFSDESVRAILSGTKTMTRRLIGKRPVKWAVGDRVWVKEAFALSIIDPDGFNDIEDDEHYDVVYRADTGGGEWTHYEPDGDGFTQTSIPPPWRSPLFMPRWASRISREVTGVRAEHLHVPEDRCLTLMI